MRALQVRADVDLAFNGLGTNMTEGWDFGERPNIAFGARGLVVKPAYKASRSRLGTAHMASTDGVKHSLRQKDWMLPAKQ